MTTTELIEALENLDPKAEVYVDNIHVVRVITRIEDDSQGVYIVSDAMAEDRENW